MIDRARAWWRKHNLAHPLSILRRLLFWPLLLAGAACVFVAAWGGYGLEDARRFWRHL